MSGADIRSRFLAARGTLKRVVVNVPELGEVTVQELTAAQRASIEELMFRDKGNERQWKLALVVRSVVDPENFLPVFEDNDIKGLGELPARTIDPIFRVAFKLSGMGEDGVEEAQGN